ncbi:uncharacterized protein [Ptychodera flava]|uniref:uncharacterized protein n=1 Tax=Ptychodera flava TaxID=63121 RepID=UPI00396A6235
MDVNQEEAAINLANVSENQDASKPKQTICIHTRQESYDPAGKNVGNSLQQLFQEENIEVVSSQDYKKQDLKQPFTVVVVIDATPDKGDISEKGEGTVSIAGELARMEPKTAPEGSFLIVIYGDELSKNLGESESIAENWLQVWRVKDDKAYDLARKGRCFSIWEDFNEKQREQIRQYINDIPKVLDVKGTARTLVIGDIAKSQVSDCVNDHPLMMKLVTDETENETEYGYFHFNKVKGREPRVQIDYNIAIPQVKICESTDISVALEEQLQEMYSTKDDTSKAHTILTSKSTKLRYEHVLVASHCDQCFNTLYEKELILTTQLKKAGITPVVDAVPLIGEEYADKVSENTRDYINVARRNTHQHSIEEDEMDGKSLLKAYIYHVCQNPKPSKGSTGRKLAISLLIGLACLVLAATLAMTLQGDEQKDKGENESGHTGLPTNHTTYTTHTPLTDHTDLFNSTPPTIPTNNSTNMTTAVINTAAP